MPVWLCLLTRWEGYGRVPLQFSIVLDTPAEGEFLGLRSLRGRGTFEGTQTCSQLLAFRESWRF